MLKRFLLINNEGIVPPEVRHMCKGLLLTSLAIVVMKAGGLAVAMRERACRAERAESAAGLRGSPILMLIRDQTKKEGVGGEEEKKH